MSLNLCAFEDVQSSELKLSLAADVYAGYRAGRYPWRTAHSALRRLAVPSDAINTGLHTETVHPVPAVIRPYLEA